MRHIPPELETLVGAEKIDFSVFSRRKKPAKHSLNIILWGSIWTAFTSIFVAILFVPILKGEELSFYVNNEPVTASLDNLEPLLFPAALIGFFVLIGITVLLVGFISLFIRGGYFVGTASRLLHYHKGNLKTFDWGQFTGNIEMHVRRGNITLQLRSGKMVGSKGRPARFVPDVVYIAGAPNVLEIEKICRERISG